MYSLSNDILDEPNSITNENCAWSKKEVYNSSSQYRITCEEFGVLFCILNKTPQEYVKNTVLSTHGKLLNC